MLFVRSLKSLVYSGRCNGQRIYPSGDRPRAILCHLQAVTLARLAHQVARVSGDRARMAGLADRQFLHAIYVRSENLRVGQFGGP